MRLGAGADISGGSLSGVGPAGVTEIGRPVSNVSDKKRLANEGRSREANGRAYYTTIDRRGFEKANRERSSPRDRKVRRERQVRRERSNDVPEPSQAGAIATQMTHITKAVPTSVSIIVEVLSPGA